MTQQTLDTSSEKSIKLSEMFDDMVARLRVDELALESGVASDEKKELYKSILENNQINLAQAAIDMGRVIIIPAMLNDFVITLKNSQISPKNLSVSFNQEKLLVWATVLAENEEMEDAVFIAEAKVNAKYHATGFHVSSTVVYDEDETNKPAHYQPIFE
ncbi:MAG: hypothetical protein ACJAWV_004382 [Flammeovirgaceae bacterium]|jgi:hypothetical protein